MDNRERGTRKPIQWFLTSVTGIRTNAAVNSSMPGATAPITPSAPGAGEPLAPETVRCPSREVISGTCDSSGDSKASRETLHAEQCSRIATIGHFADTIGLPDAYGVPIAVVSRTVARVVGPIGVVARLLKIGAGIKYALSWANGRRYK